jgi:hypothetical protein
MSLGLSLPVANLGAGVFPIHKTKLLRTRAGLAKVRAGVGNCVIAVVGDSNTRGTGSGASAGGAGAGQGYNGWPNQLAAYLKANGVNAVSETLFGGGGQDASLPTYDDRVALAGAVVFGGTVGPGGRYFSLSGVASVSFTTKSAVNTCDLYYVQGSGTGTIKWSVDGGATTNIITTNGTTGVGKSTIALGSVAVHTVKVEWVSGSNFFMGFDCYDNTTNAVRVWNWGWHGSNTGNASNWTQSQAAYGPIFAPAQATMRPDLILGMGIANDWNTSNNFTNATVAANLQTLIDNWSVNSDIVMVTPVNTAGASWPSAAVQKSYIDTLYAVAGANGFPILDEYAWMQDNATALALGLSNTDQTHKTKAGHNITATKVGRALLDWA